MIRLNHKLARLGIIAIGCIVACNWLNAADPKASAFDDVAFVKKAASGGMLEVELGRLMQKKAMSTDVKDFATHLVTDHQKANAELRKVAEVMGINLDKSMMKDHQKEYERFKDYKGSNIDRDYMDFMVNDHVEDVAEFKRASKEALNLQLRGFASDTLPTLERHLAHAKRVQAALKK